MDTHILTAPGTLASGSEAAPEACLPGEGAPPLAAGPDERSRASVPSRRRRGALLTTSCIVVAALAAGGVFLISPYNHIVPIHTARLPSAARQVAASGGFPPEVPLAPAATLATAPLPATGPPPVRKPVVADSKETQIREFQSVPHVRSGAAGSARQTGSGSAGPIGVACPAAPRERLQHFAFGARGRDFAIYASVGIGGSGGQPSAQRG